MELNSKNVKKILFIIFAGALIFTAIQNYGNVIALFNRIISIFSPVIAALCIAFVLNVLLSALENKVFKFMDKSRKKLVRKLKRPVCLLLTYILAFGIISMLILVIIPDIVKTITRLAEKMPSFVEEVRIRAELLLRKLHIEQSLPKPKINFASAANAVKKWLDFGSTKKLFGNAVGITTSVFSGIFDALFSLVISVYVLAQKEKIGRFVKKVIDAFIPEKATKVIYHISSTTQDLFSRFIGGQLIEAVILGSLCFVGMNIFRFPNALIISVIICVTALIPVVGATIGAIVGFLLIVITNPLKAVFFVIFLLILQQIEGNLIYPKVVGKAVGLPGVIVVSAVMVGGNIGGVFGTLIAVPVSAVLYTLLREAVEYKNSRKKAKASAGEGAQNPQNLEN